MKETLVQEAASHGIASWYLARGSFVLGTLSLLAAATIVGGTVASSLILTGFILICLEKQINQHQRARP
jgi:hypothetical protein